MNPIGKRSDHLRARRLWGGLIPSISRILARGFQADDLPSLRRQHLMRRSQPGVVIGAISGEMEEQQIHGLKLINHFNTQSGLGPWPKTHS